jgi:thiol:disulfide interchange protein DsbD
MKLIGLLLLLIAMNTTITAGAAETHWYTYEEGMIASGVKNMPVLIDFYADWCSPCVAMEKGTYPDSRVVSELSDFIAIKVDTQKRIDIETKYMIEYYPTIVFLNPKGNEVSRHIGYLGPDEMVGEIKKARKALNEPASLENKPKESPAFGILPLLSVLFLLSRRKCSSN